MAEDAKDDNNPWRHHPLFAAYNKFYEGKNVVRGRVIGAIIAIIVLITIILWSVF